MGQKGPRLDMCTLVNCQQIPGKNSSTHTKILSWCSRLKGKASQGQPNVGEKYADRSSCPGRYNQSSWGRSRSNTRSMQDRDRSRRTLVFEWGAN
jgi:hypothetical protein